MGKRLSDQLKTVFVSTLLLFWISTLSLTKNVAAKRSPWLPWAIASLVLFSLIILDYRRKKFRQPKLHWAFPFVAVAILWLMYYLSGISLPRCLFQSLGVIFLIWTISILIALIQNKVRILPWEKLNKAIDWFAMFGDAISWPLTLMVFSISILLGWARLWDAGMRGWWMNLLLCLGVIISVIIAIYRVSETDEIQ